MKLIALKNTAGKKMILPQNCFADPDKAFIFVVL